MRRDSYQHAINGTGSDSAGFPMLIRGHAGDGAAEAPHQLQILGHCRDADHTRVKHKKGMTAFLCQ